MEDWKEYKLGDLLTIKYGKDHKKLKEGNIPVYGSGGIMRRVNQSIYDGPSIMIPRKGSLNNVLYSDTPFWTVDTMFWSIINDNIVNPLFLYYSLCKKDFASLNVGSAVPSLTVPILNDIDVNVPTFDTQNRIVGILKSLDDKIELNRRINDNLEQQAQALFKAWFVDFEPFKDGKFVDSELGRIPENWRIGTIEELCQHIASGSTPSSMNKEYYNGNIKWFTTKELNDTFLLDSEKHISEKGHQSSSTKIKMFPTGTVLMAIYAAPTVGRLGILTSNATFNQAAVGLTPKEEVGSNYIFLLLKNERYNFNNLAIGAAQQNLSVKFIKTYTTIIPSKKVISDFNAIINSIFNRIMLLCKENSGLTNLRDTLLPKLMSGKLKIE